MKVINNSFVVLICMGIALLSLSAGETFSEPGESALQLEAKIPLGDVSGRIDHLAIDLKRHRLFVAELGNNSVGVIDLNQRKVINAIVGLKQPQGVGYHQATDTLYVANAGDGSVRMFRAPDYSEVDRINLNEDADNIRLDDATDQILVGYGNGALAVIDPKSRGKIGDIPLKGHPEGFQLDAKHQKIFVNVPEDHAISVVDHGTNQVETNWPASDARGNFPMAIDEASSQVFVVFRSPTKLRTYSMLTGKAIDELKVCSDSDDLFFDAKRKRLYVSCGTGFIDVVDASGAYKHLAHITTASGARTSLFVPELDRLFLAVRSSSGQPAAIWVFRPAE